MSRKIERAICENLTMSNLVVIGLRVFEILPIFKILIGVLLLSLSE